MRADLFLSQKGYARSREDARRSILAGLVKIGGRIISKPSEQIDPDFDGDVEFSRTVGYVGRGGVKLESALDAFGIDPEGKICIDIGASTGGFTDCLLRRGAAKVFAVDSGHGQLDPALASDPRVVNMEGVNARYLKPDCFDGHADIVVMDVSFISQTLLHGAVSGLLAPGGVFITLIKPQFECGRQALDKHGIVKDEKTAASAVEAVRASAEANGFVCRGHIDSPISGGDGNREYLALFIRKEDVVNE